MIILRLNLLLLLALISSSSLCNADIKVLLSTNNVIHLHSLESLYSTLGNPPTHVPVVSKTAFISEQNVTNDCTFKDIDDTEIVGRVLVFLGDLPSFYGCNRHLGGIPVAFARMAQSKGATAVVMKSREMFMGGRMTGVTEDITIPIVVVSNSTMKYLDANQSDIIAISFPVISPQENLMIATLIREYHGLRYSGAVVYFVSTLLLTYLLYLDVERLHQRRKRMSHNVAMKIFAVSACFASFTWLIVDPFYFESMPGWYPYMCMKIHTGFFAVDFILILRLSGKVSSKATNTLIPYRYLLCIVYPLIVIMIALTFWSGIQWYNPIAINVFYYCQIVILILCGVGFLLYGKDIWAILNKSGHSSPGKSALPVRLIAFIGCYLVGVYTGNCMNLAGTLGLVFGLLFNFFVNGLGFIMMFLILFFQPSKAVKSKPQFSGDSSCTSSSSSTVANPV